MAMRLVMSPMDRDERIGIIGPGHVGTQIAQLAMTLGLNEPLFIGQNVHPEIQTARSMDELLTRCGTIFVATGAQNVICEDQLRSVKKGQVVINVGRGKAISVEALLALREKGVVVGLDVWPDEPTQGQPIPVSMRQLVEAGVWGTMHEAAQQATADSRVAHMVAESVIAIQGGAIPRRVDPIVGYLDWKRNRIRAQLPNLDRVLEYSPDIERVRSLGAHLETTVQKGAVWVAKHLSVHEPTNSISLIGMTLPEK
jgi:phosphoglycerate dehydrogenase-like enzyme